MCVHLGGIMPLSSGKLVLFSIALTVRLSKHLSINLQWLLISKPPYFKVNSEMVRQMCGCENCTSKLLKKGQYLQLY